MIQPEGEPGDDDNHEAGDVDGDQVEGQLPGKCQVNLETKGEKFKKFDLKINNINKP